MDASSIPHQKFNFMYRDSLSHQMAILIRTPFVFSSVTLVSLTLPLCLCTLPKSRLYDTTEKWVMTIKITTMFLHCFVLQKTVHECNCMGYFQQQFDEPVNVSTSHMSKLRLRLSRSQNWLSSTVTQEALQIFKFKVLVPTLKAQ